MNMPFKEKTAWGSLVALALISYWFFPAAFSAAGQASDPARLVGVSIVCIIALIVIEAIYQSIISGAGDGASDERDALIDLKAERIAGYVLGVALFILVGRIIAIEAFKVAEDMTALTIAVWILFTLTASEFAKLASQIWYYRADA